MALILERLPGEQLLCLWGQASGCLLDPLFWDRVPSRDCPQELLDAVANSFHHP
jgi:hypothetical protein